MEPVLVRRLVLDRSAWPALSRSALTLKLGLAAVAALLALALSPVWGYGHAFAGLLLLAAPSLFVTAATNVLTVPYVAGLQLHRLAWIAAASGLAYLAGVVAAGRLGLGVRAFIACVLAYELLTLIGVSFAGRGQPRARARAGLMLEILSEARPTALAAILVTVYVRLGLLLVGAWGDLRAAGHLALATRLAEALKVAGGAVTTSTFPLFTRLAREGRRRALTRIFWAIGAGLAGAMAAVALVVQYPGRAALAALFPHYDELGAFLVPLVWAMVFAVVNMHASALFSGLGLFWVTTGAAALNLLVSLAANAVAIPRYGPVGAAWAYTATEALNASVQVPAAAAVLAGRTGPAPGAEAARQPE
jgi:O-antigen/teichoic acid export membrane protein